MRFTPVLIVYCILMFIAAIAVKKLNECERKCRIRIQGSR